MGQAYIYGGYDGVDSVGGTVGISVEMGGGLERCFEDDVLRRRQLLGWGSVQ